MTTFKNFTGNAVTITDEQIAEKWELAMIRGLARLVIEFPVARDRGETYRHLRECAASEVINVQESSTRESVGDTWGDSETFVQISGEISCSCGQITRRRVTRNIEVGQLLRGIIEVNGRSA